MALAHVPASGLGTRYLALELLGDRPAVLQQGRLTVHRGVEEQQAVQDVAGGEDLFCILKEAQHIFMERASVCVCLCRRLRGTSAWNGTISSMLLSVMKAVMFSLLSFPSSGHTKSALPSSNWQTRKVS